MKVEGWVHELDEVIEGQELGAHAGLVAEEITFHSLHEAYEAPECNGVVLFHGVDWSKEVAHALDVA